MSYVSRAGKGANLNAAEHDANFLAFAMGVGFDPIAVSTSRNLTAADAGREIFCNSATAITLTVQVDGVTSMAAGYKWRIHNRGAGVVTIAFASGVTQEKFATISNDLQQRESAEIIKTADANTYYRSA